MIEKNMTFAIEPMVLYCYVVVYVLGRWVKGWYKARKMARLSTEQKNIHGWKVSIFGEIYR